MKITCHSCQAKYTVSDDKVQGKTVKMKCRKCGATIVVGGAGQTDGASSAGDASSAQEVEGAGGDLAPGSYLVNVADGDQRTMTLAEVLDAYNTSVVNADTYVWSDGMADWQPLGENATITNALHEAAGGSNGGHVSTPSPAAPVAPESTRPAARKEPARRNDLFGGSGFSDSGGGGLSSSVSASASGKRDENSVLFSLSALTSASAPAAKSSGTSATKEDSGLIDLRALAATAAPSPSHNPSPVAESVALFPLGAPMLAPPPLAPMMSGPGSMIAPAPASSKTLPLVLGAIVALAAIAAVFFLLKGSPPPPAPAPVATVAAEPLPTAAPAATQSAAAAPTDTASAAAPASASAVAVSGKGPIHNYGKPGPVSKPGTDTGPAKPVTKPVSGKGTCGCAAGDLMCAMKCSAH